MKASRQYKINVIIPFVTMADIAFLLLIFLIVTSSVQKNPELKLTLPQSAQFDKIKKKKNVELFVSKGGEIIFEQDRYDVNDLISVLPEDEQCIISADKETDFKLIHNIIEVLKNNDYEKIAFTVTRKADISIKRK
ncbi:MAG: biopolymer transporter ExbD [Endomicrobiales bacterium]|nr:biopolymer transporter ExbD [Endomicrobiales bacterium]